MKCSRSFTKTPAGVMQDQARPGLPKHESAFCPDIIVVSLQELVELKVGATIKGWFTSKPELPEEAWGRLILELLNEDPKRPKYVLHKSKVMVGLGAFIFFKESFRKQVSGFIFEEVKFGFYGMTGNKGVLIFSMVIHDSRIAFCCGHLPSGTGKDNKEARLDCIKTVVTDYMPKYHVTFFC